MQKMKVVIIGGGFGGLQAAIKLGNHPHIEIILIDRRNHHLFQPLLYQVAMAGLSPAEIATPIRSILAKYKNIHVILAEVTSINCQQKSISFDNKDFSFDYLVMACGAKHSYFGNNHWEPHAPGLKTVEQAIEIRRRVLLSFELAEKTEDESDRKKYMTFAIVGGGPTGVELAGAIAEISRFTLKKDFRNISLDQVRVVLVEAGERILSSFDEVLSIKAKIDLEKLGVEVQTRTRVIDISADGIKMGKDFLPAATVLWAAGVTPSSLNQQLGVPLDNKDRVFIEADLSLKNYENIFVIGDQANFTHYGDDTLPGLAPVALQQGRHVAKNIMADFQNRPRGEFHYIDKGQMATIGRMSAVMQFKGIRSSGLLAWLAWLFIHIYFLIGFKNRVFVLLDWLWQYFYYGRGARLITHKNWRSYKSEKREDLK